jgi:hypothetical protein
MSPFGVSALANAFGVNAASVAATCGSADSAKAAGASGFGANEVGTTVTVSGSARSALDASVRLVAVLSPVDVQAESPIDESMAPTARKIRISGKAPLTSTRNSRFRPGSPYRKAGLSAICPESGGESAWKH